MPPMNTPPGSRLGSAHHPPLRTDSVRKRLAEAVKSKTMHHQQQHGGKVYVNFIIIIVNVHNKFF